MLTFRIVYVLFGCLYMVCTEGSIVQSRKERGASGEWGYTDKNGPQTWGGVCQTGKMQSPINIELGTVIARNYSSFVFEDEYLNQHKFVAKNNGHTVYVTLEDDSIKPAIYGGGLENKFIFEQLHLHWESEHEFDGKRADLEMHIVHYNSKYESFAEASQHSDGLVVLAVIFNESEDTDVVIEDFFSHILSESNDASLPLSPPQNNLLLEEKEEVSSFYSLRDLLPANLSRFFRYVGSLTTPGCGEVVQWTIFINRMSVSSDALSKFRTLRDSDGNLLLQNYRPPQSLNRREVYIQITACDKGQYESLKPNATSGTGLHLLPIPVLCGLLLLSPLN